MRPEDRDILFGDRFGGDGGGSWSPGDSGAWTPEGAAAETARIDALMDAYFDGEISEDDRVRLFELLRRDPDRCLRFVEMQRTALLLERQPAGPDQTEAILARLDAAAPLRARAAGRRASFRIGPAAGRLGIAAAVALAGAGIVILGQVGPPRPQRAASHALPAATDTPPAERQAPALAESPAPLQRAALGPGRLSSTRASLFSDPGQPELAIHGLGSGATGPAPALDPALATPDARAAEMRRLIGFAYGGQPWRLLGVWPVPEAQQPVAQPAGPASRPAPRPALSDRDRAAQ